MYNQFIYVLFSHIYLTIFIFEKQKLIGKTCEKQTNNHIHIYLILLETDSSKVEKLAYGLVGTIVIDSMYVRQFYQWSQT